MIVVADTSPLNYLVLVGQDSILAALYGRVVRPPAVIAEMCHADAPPIVQAWARNPPPWLAVQPPSIDDLELAALGDGERQAICLTIELNADLLLIDERAGRLEAVRRGLRIAGTLAVLEEAAHKGLLSFSPTLAAIRKAGFRVSAEVVADFLKRTDDHD